MRPTNSPPKGAQVNVFSKTEPDLTASATPDKTLRVSETKLETSKKRPLASITNTNKSADDCASAKRMRKSSNNNGRITAFFSKK